MIKLMAARYNEHSYHCVHFAVDVWKRLTGNDLSEQFAPLLTPVSKIEAVSSAWDGFAEVAQPADPCIVLMRNGTDSTHMGVFTDGRVLHIRDTGPHAAVIPHLRTEYPRMRFFVCEN